MREDRQLENIINILKGYNGKEPLHRYLKSHFRDHRQMGSRDRKLAADFIFNYFRIGKALSNRSVEERMTAGNYVCSTTETPLLQYCVEQFLKIAADSQVKIEERIAKIQSVYPDFNIENIFQFSDHVSDKVDKHSFVISHLKQPKLWIRVRKKFLKEVTNELEKENIPFEAEGEIFSFAHSTKLDKLQSYEKGYFEIQDWASQLVAAYFKPNPNERWWDACAGSGGKSLMLYDAEPTVHITVTDIRESILNNLKERFRKVQLRSYDTQQMDLTNSKPETVSPKPFDGIIADVPCTGSGTWARSPEWLMYFDEQSIAKFVDLQKRIISNVVPYLKKDAPLIYITCSVFKEENEEVIDWIQKEHGLRLEESAYIKGYDKGADTMFVGRLIKN